tara:strand:+ start:2490 stop:3203 length:714 start_codon:yes stop_codon:yes gene_type:complete
MAIPKVIHQIFFDIGKGKSYKNIPDFVSGHNKTKEFCVEYGIQLKFWEQKDVEELLNSSYPEFVELWGDFREPIQRVDFARYMILHSEGGIYLDLDVHPMKDISELWEKEFFFVRWNNDTKPYNAILGTEAGTHLYENIMNHSRDSTYEKQDMEIYNTWIGRLVFQTTGHHMLNRVLKKNKIQEILNIVSICNSVKHLYVCSPDSLFYDTNTSAWYEEKKSRSWATDDVSNDKMGEV